jgi:hypothetical protein
MVTAVVVTFAIAGVMRLSTRDVPVSPSDTPGSRLDSAKYQREIEALETTLYQEAPPSMTDFMTISAAFHDMGLSIADRELNPASRDVASDVAMLAARSGVGESSFAVPDIGELRADWESLRSAHFADAEWFRASTPAVEAAQAVPAPSADPAIIGDLLRTIDEMEGLVQQGQSACTELGEPFYDYEQPGSSGYAHIDRWNEFAREWDDDVSRAASHMPAPPAWDADTEITMAYQEITSAIREMRHATMGSGSWPVPFEAEWSMRFGEALRLLEQSRSRLSAR